MLAERVEASVAAQGGDPFAASEQFRAMLAAPPAAASLSREQVDLRRALGVL